jgi:ribose 5-phosphate isomerase RpiB
MKVYFASDHAGFDAKNKLVEYVRDQLKCEVEDCGALGSVEIHLELMTAAAR